MNEEQKKKMWDERIQSVFADRRYEDDKSLMVNRMPVRQEDGYFKLEGIIVDYEQIKAMDHVGVIVSDAARHSERTRQLSSSDVFDILEAAGVIPSDIRVVFCINSNDFKQEADLNIFPFDWNDAKLLYRTNDPESALYSDADFQMVDGAMFSHKNPATMGALIASRYVFDDNGSEYVLDQVSKLYVGRCAYKFAWMYANYTSEYDERFRNGWPRQYLIDAVKTLSCGKIVIEEDDIRGYSDALIRSDFQVEHFLPKIKEKRPSRYRLGQKLNETLWMIQELTRGVKIEDDQDKLNALVDFLAEKDLPYLISVMFEHDIPARDLLAGRYESTEINIGDTLIGEL